MKSFSGKPNAIQTTSSISSATDALITNPQNNQVLTYNSTNKKWENENVPSAPVTSVFTRTGAITAQANDYSIAQITNSSILADSNNLAFNSVSLNDSLLYNGSKWANKLLNCYVNFYALFNFTGVTAEANAFYFCEGNNTVNVNANPKSGTKLGIRVGINGSTINLSNSLYTNSTIYNGSATITANTNNSVIELSYINNNFQNCWFITSFYGNWTINGSDRLCSMRNITEIGNVSITSPASNQVLQFNGSNWVNASLPSAPITSVFSRTGVVTAQANDYSIAQITNSSILADSNNISITTPSNNQILTYNSGSSKWTNSTVSSSNVYYNVIQTTDTVVTAIPNTHHILTSGGTITIPAMLTNDHIMITARVSPVTVNFGGTSLIMNIFPSGPSNPPIVLKSTTIELVCSYGTTNPMDQTLYYMIRVNQNNYGSSLTVFGAKISAIGELQCIPDVLIDTPINGQYLRYDSSDQLWKNSTATFGSVNSVALSLPSIFTVSGSPITNSGTLTGTLNSQLQNLIFASPNGSSGTPTFRALTNNDFPNSGVSANTYNSVTVNSKGIITSASNISIVNSFNSRTGSVVPASGDYNITQLAGVSISSPSTNQVLTYNGTNWVNQNTTSGAVPNFISFGGTTYNTGSDFYSYTATFATVVRSCNIFTDANVTSGQQANFVIRKNGSTFTNIAINGPANSGSFNNLNLTLAVGDVLSFRATSSGGSVGTTFYYGNVSLSFTFLTNLGDVSISSPTTNQVLAYNGSNWANTTIASAPVTSVFSRTGAITAQTNDYSISQINGASVLAADANLNIISPQTNDVLYYNGTYWANTKGTNFITYQSNGSISTGLTTYLLHSGSSTTLANGQIVLPRACTITGLSIYINTTSAGTWTSTLFKNGVTTGSSCTTAANAATASTTINNSCSQFDRIAVQIVGSSVTASIIYASLLYI